jgi:hypothetical protein
MGIEKISRKNTGISIFMVINNCPHTISDDFRMDTIEERKALRYQ